MLAQYSVVIDLSIDRQSAGVVIVQQRLCSGIDADNAEAFVRKDCVVACPVAAPVRSTREELIHY